VIAGIDYEYAILFPGTVNITYIYNMKKITISVSIIFMSLSASSQTLETFHDFSALTILHDTLQLSSFAGKKVLVVNTASFCAYTYEYADLVTLDSLYGGPTFAIVGFPCNDFGGQEPGDDSTILNFCTSNYNVDFQMMSRISITAPDTAEVYKWLQLQSRNGVADAPVSWNFHKFCIDEAGQWVMHFPQQVNPLDTAITNWILSPNTTGIEAHDNPSISIAGNPAYGNIKIDLKISRPEVFSFVVYDMQGRLLESLFSGRINSSGTISFLPKHLASGIYLLDVKSESTREMIRVCYLD